MPGLHWGGVALATVLEAAGVAEQARFVQASAGEFSVPLSLDAARRALLATRLGDTPLPREHGWPVRLVVPGDDCFTSVKWLDRIELRAQPGANTGRDIALGRLPR